MECRGSLRTLGVHAGFDGVVVVGFGGVGEGAAEAGGGFLRGHVYAGRWVGWDGARSVVGGGGLFRTDA